MCDNTDNTETTNAGNTETPTETTTEQTTCVDISPSTDPCNKTCCPYDETDDDWCKAFHKKVLEQQKELTRLMVDGMWFNLEDARNVITQTEQYLCVIYELLLAAQDEVMKASSTASRTEGDYDSASVKIAEYVKEIDKIAKGAQYNGRYLFEDDVDSTRNAIIFRLVGGRGLVRNGTTTHNDFIFELLSISIKKLGLDGTENKSTNLQDYSTGLGWDEGADDGVDSPETGDDDVDETITDFNYAISRINVGLEKLKAYRFILCNKEKQIKIFIMGMNKCIENKERI